jgi:hypothetical protein
MKKLTILTGLVLLAGAAFAQNQPPMGKGEMPPVEWKIGTVVTTEYTKVTGQLILGQRLEPVLKADGAEYLLKLPSSAYPLIDAKNGDTITVEGLATTVKADVKVQPVFRPFKITANGKETDLTALRGRMGGHGMMGQGPADQDDPRNDGPRD